MHYILLTCLSLIRLVTNTDAAALHAALEPRLVCYENNALRAMQVSSTAATSFCKTYIHIPTPTNFVSVAHKTPVTKTVTTSWVQSRYPDGHIIETIALPSYVEAEDPQSVSTACSCLSISPPAVTSTASLATVTTTLTLNPTTTVTGICATQTRTYGALNLAIPYGDTYWHLVEATSFTTNISNSYECCNQCFANPAYANCIGWNFLLVVNTVYGDTECNNIYETPQDPSGKTTCPLPQGNATFDPDPAYLNYIMGPGPCPAVIGCCS